MIEHRPETDAADITVGRSINSVAERHVVSRHRLCDCARGAADKKEPARDFLAGANFRESPVTFGVEINLERFLIRPDIHLRFHISKMSAFMGFSTAELARPKSAVNPSCTLAAVYERRNSYPTGVIPRAPWRSRDLTDGLSLHEHS